MSSSPSKPSPIIPRGARPRFRHWLAGSNARSGGRPGVMTCDGRYQANDRSFRALVIIRRRAQNVLIRPPGPSRRTLLNPWRTAESARRSRRVGPQVRAWDLMVTSIRELARDNRSVLLISSKNVSSHFERVCRDSGPVPRSWPCHARYRRSRKGTLCRTRGNLMGLLSRGE